MFLRKSLSVSEFLDKSLEKTLSLFLFNDFKINNVAVNAYYSEDIYQNEIWEIKEATPLENNMLACDIIVYLSPKETETYAEVQMVALLAHILSLVTIKWAWEKPYFFIDNKNKNRIHPGVLQLFGDQSPVYKDTIQQIQNMREPEYKEKRHFRPLDEF